MQLYNNRVEVKQVKLLLRLYLNVCYEDLGSSGGILTYLLAPWRRVLI